MDKSITDMFDVSPPPDNVLGQRIRESIEKHGVSVNDILEACKILYRRDAPIYSSCPVEIFLYDLMLSLGLQFMLDGYKETGIG